MLFIISLSRILNPTPSKDYVTFSTHPPHFGLRPFATYLHLISHPIPGASLLPSYPYFLILTQYSTHSFN
ncbi:hypothetical protein BGS_0821 [Beggiatoa sp. SS]|nr:hypothetical protein BGS_0821 [Beggiatoa sp. SS]